MIVIIKIHFLIKKVRKIKIFSNCFLKDKNQIILVIVIIIVKIVFRKFNIWKNK